MQNYLIKEECLRIIELMSFPQKKELILTTTGPTQTASYNNDNSFTDYFIVLYEDDKDRLKDGVYSSDKFEEIYFMPTNYNSHGSGKIPTNRYIKLKNV